MQLNFDCVREVLLAIEANKIDHILSYPELCELLPFYSPDDIRYTCVKLQEAKIISAIISKTLDDPFPEVTAILDITFKGHEFLNSIRDKGTWEKVRKTAKTAGVGSFDAFMQIASAVAAQAIKAALQQL